MKWEISLDTIVLIIILLVILYTNYCQSDKVTEGFATNIADADVSAIRNLNGLANTLMQPNGTLTNPGNLTIQGQTRITNSKNDPQLVITSLNENSAGNTNPTVFMEAFNGPNNVKRDISIAAWGGNVGIGLINPGTKLDVAGNINSTGNITASGTLSIPGYPDVKAKLDSLQTQIDDLKKNAVQLNKSVYFQINDPVMEGANSKFHNMYYCDQCGPGGNNQGNYQFLRGDRAGQGAGPTSKLVFYSSKQDGATSA